MRCPNANGRFDIARNEILLNTGGYPPASGRQIAEGHS